MFEILILALLFTAAAGLWDLKTTEVPDEIPAIMIVAGISYWLINTGITGEIMPLLLSLAIGTALLVMGLVLYKKGQWGGADAWILAAVGYMIPLYNGEIFILPYIMNFFVVSAAYMVVYATIIGIRNRKVFGYFVKDIKKNKKTLFLPFAFLAFFGGISLYLTSLGYSARIMPVVEMFLVLLFLTLFWRYGKIIEEKVFKKKIPTSRLRVGDVLEEMNWIGLSERQVAALKKRKRFVTIKEGVRFVPVFFIALLTTILFGNLLFIFLGI
jgi:Flp pilus assembly protein protease CpaA